MLNIKEDDEDRSNFRLLIISKAVIKIKAILTSYEIVCAILRKAPSKENLALDDHPAAIIAYTVSLDTHKNKTTGNLNQ